MYKLFLTLLLLINMCVFVCAQIPADSLGTNKDSLISLPVAPPSSNKVLPAITDFRGTKINENHECLYNIKPIIDVPLCLIGSIGAPLGFYLINKKPSTDTNVILNLD